MMQYVMIPHERIGVLIGPQAAVKRAIEEKTGCELQISSSTGTVEISHADPLMALRTREIVLAIGRGFNPEKAMRLSNDEALVFEIIDISEYASSEKDIKRVMLRYINLSQDQCFIIGKTHGFSD
ncbi:MAG: ribosomal RNA assembly protein [Desulfobacteraceae bacterium Eth-SRB1]|nr:MAG: ribosomal RNA assembly protein [Desulfobacteraceae bacterium Eth-SRB1]